MHDARVRIERAKGNVERLHTTVATTDASDFHGVDFKHDGKGNVRALARVLKPPPEEWRLLIGDILVDLRGALDYAVYSLAVSNAKGLPANPRSTEFPIAKDAQRFANGGRRRIDQISTDARAYIESIQPYQPGHTLDTDALWVLNELVGINKHRFIPIAWFVLKETMLDFNVDGATIEDVVGYRVEGELKHGTVLATFRLVAKSQAQVQIQASITTHVAFEQGPPAFGNEAVSTLRMMGGVVEHVVGKLAEFA